MKSNALVILLCFFSSPLFASNVKIILYIYKPMSEQKFKEFCKQGESRQIVYGLKLGYHPGEVSEESHINTRAAQMLYRSWGQRSLQASDLAALTKMHNTLVRQLTFQADVN